MRAMKIICVAFTLVAALAVGASKRCDEWIASSDALIRTVHVEEAMTWKQLDDECSHQYRGFLLLHSRPSVVGDPEKRICGEELVPLAVKNEDNNFYWISRGTTDKKPLSDADRNYMMLNEEEVGKASIGALNLTSGFWHLVDENHPFLCALCQMRDDEVARSSITVDGKINRTNLDSVGVTAQASRKQFEFYLRSTMFSMKSKNITNVTQFLTNSPDLMKNITDWYNTALQSKVSFFLEGTQLLQRLSEAQLKVNLLSEVTNLASDMARLNDDILLKVQIPFYKDSLHLYQIEEMMRYLRRVLKGDDNFLWNKKENTQNMIKSLEKIAINLQLGGQRFQESSSRNAHIFVEDIVDNSSSFTGFGLINRTNNFDLKPFRQREDSELNQTAYKFYFPPAAIHPGSRIAGIVLVFKDNMYPKKIIHPDSVYNLTPVVHLVISGNSDVHAHNTPIDVSFDSGYSHSHKSISKYVTRECSYWDSSNATWSAAGCQLMNSTASGSLNYCRCTQAFEDQCDTIKTAQVTVEEWNDYAAYLSNNRLPHKPKKNALGFITIIGYSFTLFGIIGIFVTYISFNAWSAELENTALLHLCLAVLLNISLLIVTTFVPVPKAGTACIAVGAGIHYSFIACFTWVLNMTGLQFMAISNDLKKIHKSTLSCLLFFGWVIPLLPLATIFSWDPQLYTSLPTDRNLLENGGPSFIVSVQELYIYVMRLVGVKKRFIHESLNEEVCYPEGFSLHVGERIPIGSIVAFNVVLIFLTFCKLFIYNKERYSTEVIRKLISHLLVLFYLGLPFGFSFMSFIDINEVFAYIFAVVVTTIGLALFILFVVLDDKAIACWGSLCLRDKSYVINYNEPSTIPRYRGATSRELFNRGNFYEHEEEMDGVETSSNPGQSFEMSTEPFAMDIPKKPLTKNMILED